MMHMKTCIHYSTRTCWPVIRYVCVYYCNITINTVQYGCLISWGSNFCGFLSMVIYEVLCTWCLWYGICSAWFLDIRISTCLQNHLRASSKLVLKKISQKFNIHAAGYNGVNTLIILFMFQQPLDYCSRHWWTIDNVRTGQSSINGPGLHLQM